MNAKELAKIKFNRSKGSTFDFDMVPLEGILNQRGLDHDPRILHQVDFYVLIIVSEGEGKHTIDFEEYSYSKGSVISIRKDQLHHFHEGNARGSLLLFTQEYIISHLEQLEIDKISAFFNELLFGQHTKIEEVELNSILALIDQIHIEFTSSTDVNTSGIIRNLLQVILSKIYRHRRLKHQHRLDRKYDLRFVRFQKLVELNCNHTRNVQFYSDQLSITTRTLNNITQAILKKPAKRIITETTILQIKRLLINTKLSVKEIAYETGFNEPTNLFKFFKKHTSKTPELFRELHSTKN